MINYSIVMRSVNANLFEINQAKSRVKAARHISSHGCVYSRAEGHQVRPEHQTAERRLQCGDIGQTECRMKSVLKHFQSFQILLSCHFSWGFM